MWQALGALALVVGYVLFAVVVWKAIDWGMRWLAKRAGVDPDEYHDDDSYGI